MIGKKYVEKYEREYARMKRLLRPPRNLKSMTDEEYLDFVRQCALKYAGQEIELTGGRKRNQSSIICSRHRIPRVDVRVDLTDPRTSIARVRYMVAALRALGNRRKPRVCGDCPCDEAAGLR